MHNAPAVSYPVGRSRFQARLSLVMLVLGLLASVAWYVQVQTPGWQQWLMLLGVVFTGVGAFWQWRQTPIGQLGWDGARWCWSEAGASVTVQVVVVLDLQQALLLMLRGTRGARGLWIWVDRDASPTRWLALRRAVHQHPRVEKDPLLDGNPPGTSPP